MMMNGAARSGCPAAQSDALDRVAAGAWRGDWRWPDAPWMISLASSGLGAGSVQARMASRSERHDWRAPDGGQ